MEYVPSADFQRKIGYYQDKAMLDAVVVTRNGRDRLVLLSAAEYYRLKQLDREVLSVGDLSEEDLQAIAAAEVPAEYAHLDNELDA